MRPLTRPPAPEVLKKTLLRKWTKAWQAKCRSVPPKEWVWPTVQKQKLNKRLTPVLKKMTGNRCSFCDSAVQPASPRTVEHFLAKSRYHCSAFHWPNLYYCCAGCQAEKLERSDRHAVRPDEPGYAFVRYYRYVSGNGRILTNPMAGAAARQRALLTIRLYHLNRRDLREARVSELEMGAKDPAQDISLRPHQYLRPWTRRS